MPQDDPESISVQAMLVRREGDAAGFAIALALEESLVFPHMRMQRANNLQESMKIFLKDLPEPVAKAPVVPIHAAMSANVIAKAERLELLLNRAKPPKFSAGAWWGNGEQDDAAVVRNSRASGA